MKKQLGLSTDIYNSFKVFIRVRPFQEYEINQSANKQYLNFNQTQIALKNKNEGINFTFDRIYRPEQRQEKIFEEVADDIIDNAFLGINGTIFCYGQTSSGKTHTIVGQLDNRNEKEQGLLPRILRDVIERKNTKIENVKQCNLDIRIKISMVEIYNQKVSDLFNLNKIDLKLRENKKQGVFIENVTEEYILTIQQALKFVKSGLDNRATGKTNSNAYSSRSHMVFVITIHETNFQTREAKSAKITLIDLAGSQKLSKTGVQGKMLIESKKINTSLSALSKVIQALSDEKINHIPYRDSKLTRLLQQSIGGNSLTRLIINISPSIISETETLTSLRFGVRAKLIKNKPKVNKQYTVQELLYLLQKAELKIKQQIKIIQGYEKGLNSTGGSNSNYNIRRNGGYLAYEKPLTLHMIGYDEDEFDDASSIGSQSISKSVTSNQDQACNSIFEHTGPFESRFCNTNDFQLGSSLKKKKRKPNLCMSKSMKSIVLSKVDNDQDSQLFRQFDIEKDLKSKEINLSQKKSIKIIQKDDTKQQKLNQNIIYEQNESSFCDESTKNSMNTSELPGKLQINRKDSEMINFNQQISTENATVKLSEITENQIKFPVKLLSKDFSALAKQKSKNIQQSRKQLFLQYSQQFKKELILDYKQQLRKQMKQKLRQQIRQQLHVQIQSQLSEQYKIIKQSLQCEFKESVQILKNEVMVIRQELGLKEKKLSETIIQYEDVLIKLEEQKQVCQDKNKQIVELRQKYKIKKSHINKQITKLRKFWEGQMPNMISRE